MLKLYFGPGACSFVPHVGLEIVKAATGEAYDAQMVKLHRGEHKTPEYLAMNPNGQVPLLLVDGQPLTQIVAICDYIDRRYPQVGLMPSDPWQHAKAMSLLAWMNNTVHPTFTHVFMPDKFADDDTVRAAVKTHAIGQYRTLLGRLDALVAGASPWLGGASLGFLDAYALTLLRWGGFAGIDPDSLPALKAFVDRVAAQAPVAAVLQREGIALNTFKKAA